jgi:hypothetical protein
MFEHRSQALISRAQFLRRMATHAAIAAGVVAGSLLIGVLGYRLSEGMPWVDALLEAAMILAGMGPVHEFRTLSGKLFATGYALFSGIVFLTIAAVLLGPVLHRFLHRFHLDVSEHGGKEARSGRAER